MKKALIYIVSLVIASAGFVACDDETAYPPVIMGDIKGDGTAESPFNIAAAVRQAAANGSSSTDFVFVEGYVVSGSIDTSYGNASWDLYDNTEGTGQKFIAYRVKGFDNKKFTDPNQVKIGDKIVLYTPVINYNDKTPETGNGGYLYSVNGEVGSTIVPTEPSTPGEAKGDGTAANPYNATAATAKAIANGTESTENVYVAGYIKSGEISSQYGSGTWVISDNADGTGGTFELYATYDFGGDRFTDVNKVKVGDYIVAVGPIYNFKGNTPEMSKGHLYSLNGNTEGGEQGGGEEQPTGDVVFSETFTNGDLGSFAATVETSGSWTGWRANTGNVKCAIANSYVNSTNEAATAWLISPAIDLTGATKATLSVEQGFGFFFPTEQTEFCTVNVRESGTEAWTTLTLTNFPPKKESGNWTDFAENTMDISAFAGKKIEIGFKYVNDGKQSVAWEICNLTVKK